jgi:hypothetical protein
VPVSGAGEFTRPVVFAHWLPLGNDDAITVKRDDFGLRLWFDRSSLAHVSDVPLEEIARHIIVLVANVHVDVETQIADDLGEFIYNESTADTRTPAGARRAESFVRLNHEYGALGRRILLEVLGLVNRLIAYARVHKGQYWLEPIDADPDLMMSRNALFGATVRVLPRDWCRWNPPGGNLVKVGGAFAAGEDRYIEQATGLR